MIGTFASLVLMSQAKPQTLLIDPLKLVEAAEIWSVIGNARNPVWPGWDASKTPVMVYFPGRQEVLVNHPKPPEGFERYRGAFTSPIGSIFLRTGKTTFDLDGQNTSTEVNGVETLVVADTQSTKRQWIESIADSIVQEPSEADKIVEGGIFSDPMSSMTMFAHEAFHVYQRKMAPKKGGNEMALARYPTLSVDNNTWLAIEADSLKAALEAPNLGEARKAGVRWLAARQARRKLLSKESAAYEDGTEFSEGLAMYVEYRTLQCLQGKTPGKDMWLVQGFAGYGDLTKERGKLISAMQHFMDGTNTVNNDLYGASPVRFRLYYSGMAIGALLDRLGLKWHDRVLKTDDTLTSLATEALAAKPDDLSQATDEIRASVRFKELWAQKTKLADDGAVYVREQVAKFTDGPGELVLDYSQLKSPKVGFAFTPFGILSVNPDQTIYRLIPIRGLIGALNFSEDSPRAILHDTKVKTVHIQLTGQPTMDGIGADGTVNAKELKLPGVSLKDVKGKVVIEGKRVTIRLED
ncbi:MAG: hypothetical protein JST12_16305 [Armatimonadetes bacterium]|nr:hypothetical protein [Armatimonadota bacterium]